MTKVQARFTGFTLIELLIAITVGLIVVSVASGVLQQTIQGNRKIRDSAMLQESAYFTSHLVEQHLRQAGFKNIDTSMVAGRRIPMLQDEEIFTEVTDAWAQGQYLKADADSISIRFNGSSDSSDVADGSIIDCAGDAVAEGELADVSLSLDDGSLICSSSGIEYPLIGSEDTLNVEALTITLGIDDGLDGSIDRYVDSAAAVAADFGATREVLLRLLLVSNTHLDALGRTYTYNGSQVDYTDNRYRREVLIRTLLRNVVATS